MECDVCGMRLPENPETCPNCDTPLNDSEQDNRSQNQPRQQDHRSGQTESQRQDGQSDQPGYQSGQAGSQQQDDQSEQSAYQSDETGSQQPGYQSGEDGSQQPGYQSGQTGSQQGPQSGRAGSQQTGYQSGQTGPQQQGYQSGEVGSQQPGYQPGQSQPQQQPPQPEQNRSVSGLLSQISIVGGILYGSIAFIISLIIHSILLLSAVSNSTSESLVDAAGEGVWYFIGWMFYNAHTVPIESTVAGTSGNLLEEIYQLGGSQISLPKITFYALPVVVLFLFGYTLANRATQSDVPSLHSAVAGASIGLGYGIFSVLGSYVFTLTYLGESASPAMGSVIMMMVIVYPVAIGGGAGYLAGG